MADEARNREIVEAGYDNVADRYAELEAPGHEWPRMRRLAKLLARIEPGGAVLDVGCGNGVPATRAMSERFHATGIDISLRSSGPGRMSPKPGFSTVICWLPTSARSSTRSPPSSGSTAGCARPDGCCSRSGRRPRLGASASRSLSRRSSPSSRANARFSFCGCSPGKLAGRRLLHRPADNRGGGVWMPCIICSTLPGRRSG